MAKDLEMSVSEILEAIRMLSPEACLPLLGSPRYQVALELYFQEQFAGKELSHGV